MIGILTWEREREWEKQEVGKDEAEKQRFTTKTLREWSDVNGFDAIPLGAWEWGCWVGRVFLAFKETTCLDVAKGAPSTVTVVSRAR